MIKYETHLGQIGISQRYFEKLIGNAVSSCYGVTNMIPKGMKWWRSKLVKRRFADTGIRVRGKPPVDSCRPSYQRCVRP